jgi:Fe-S cluster biogenesis protein NfuA
MTNARSAHRDTLQERIMGFTPDTNHIPREASDEERLRALVDTVSSYIEYYHGGWVKLTEFDGETATVELGGACVGCPFSPATLQGWMAGIVRNFFPKVEVVAVQAEAFK